MKLTTNAISGLSIAAIALLVSGCLDPFTKNMRRYGYVAAIPAPATLHIGSIYDTADLRTPYALMRDLFTATENEALMASLKDDVSIPDSSAESSFKISAEADIVGKAKVELEAHGITKFKVTFGGATQYLISKTKFEDDVYPKIKSKLHDRKLDKKFAIVALLQVSSLEYEFYNEKGGKVSVTPGGELEKVLKDKIGVEWSANHKDNLSITSPKFIGYRMARLTEEGYKMLRTGEGKNKELIQDISPDDLRNAAR